MRLQPMAMNIVTLTSNFRGGGAEKMACELARGLLQRGMNSHVRVMAGEPLPEDPFVSATPFDYSTMSYAQKIPHYLLSKLQNAGIEQCASMASGHIFEQLPFRPDILLGHILRGDLLRIEDLRGVCGRAPLIWTLHDMWSFTGHCAYAFDCTRWQRRCGSCPYPDTYVPVRHDFSRLNLWRRKRVFTDIASSMPGRLHIVCPSRWIAGLWARGIGTDLPVHVINYGIETDVFSPFPPEERRDLRRKFQIPEQDFTILFLAHQGRKNPFKDYATFEAAVRQLRRENIACHVVTVGESGTTPPDSDVRSLGIMQSSQQMAEVYNSADLFVHTTKADTFPLTVLESMACGLAVVGTDIGGVREQIDDGVTGCLIEANRPDLLAESVRMLKNSPERRRQLGAAAHAKARKLYARDRMLDDYIRLAQRIVDECKTS